MATQYSECNTAENIWQSAQKTSTGFTFFNTFTFLTAVKIPTSPTAFWLDNIYMWFPLSSYSIYMKPLWHVFLFISGIWHSLYPASFQFLLRNIFSLFSRYFSVGWGKKVRTRHVVQSQALLNYSLVQNHRIWCRPTVTGFDGFNWTGISGRWWRAHRGWGTGPVTRWQWQRRGCHRLLSPGLPVSCAYL